MNKPYIICHMMTSLDGRIDCAVTPLKLTQVREIRRKRSLAALRPVKRRNCYEIYGQAGI